MGTKTPELDVFDAISDTFWTIENFIGWLEIEKRMHLVNATGGTVLQDELEEAMYDYFELDKKKIEEERKALLAEAIEENKEVVDQLTKEE